MSDADAPSATAALLRAAHIGPTLAVTTVVALLAVGQHLPADRGVLVTAAVFSGQLTIGWGNDLLDEDRDRQVGRESKPLVNGAVSSKTVMRCLVVAAVGCVVLSLTVGWRSAVVHLGLGVASGHVYNLALKRTPWSWLPYATAFGTLPAVVTLADVPHPWPPLWMMAAAAALGVAAHFLNVLPDLGADLVTGVRGLPHRIGPVASRAMATPAAGRRLAPRGSRSEGLADSADLGGRRARRRGRPGRVAACGRGQTPFKAAAAIALVDALLLTVLSS